MGRSFVRWFHQVNLFIKMHAATVQLPLKEVQHGDSLYPQPADRMTCVLERSLAAPLREGPFFSCEL